MRPSVDARSHRCWRPDYRPAPALTRRPALIYRILFDRLLGRLDAEAAHRVAATALRIATSSRIARRLLHGLLGPRDRCLGVRALGLDFESPLGVAAGVDKGGTWFAGLGALGFGSVEVGTVTARPQPGNPRPRIFRFPGRRALVNRMGFPNPGAATVAARLGRRTEPPIVGVNIGKAGDVSLEDIGADYSACAGTVAAVADYLVVNVSSPNTPGLRDAQAVDRLGGLIGDVRATLATAGRHVPLLVKIAPDLSDAEIDAVADLALELGIDGIVAVNTTVDPAVVRAVAGDARSSLSGGVSGAPLSPRALAVLRRLRARVGDRLVLVSVGGIESAADAWERIAAGATLVQAYTGFVYGGPLWPWRVNRGLSTLAREARVRGIQEVVGTAAPAGADGRERAPSVSP